MESLWTDSLAFHSHYPQEWSMHDPTLLFNLMTCWNGHCTTQPRLLTLWPAQMVTAQPRLALWSCDLPKWSMHRPTLLFDRMSCHDLFWKVHNETRRNHLIIMFIQPCPWLVTRSHCQATRHRSAGIPRPTSRESLSATVEGCWWPCRRYLMLTTWKAERTPVEWPLCCWRVQGHPGEADPLAISAPGRRQCSGSLSLWCTCGMTMLVQFVHLIYGSIFYTESSTCVYISDTPVWPWLCFKVTSVSEM